MPRGVYDRDHLDGTLLAPVAPRLTRCTAHSARTGNPCRAWAVRGATVCEAHGGMAPQVLRSARARREALIEPSIDAIEQLVESADSEQVRLAAARDVLDRTGYRATEQVQVEVAVKLLDREAWESI